MQPAIEQIDLSKSLAGSEGVDNNHASRIRIQALLDQHATLVTQTQFADTKSAGLVTLIGLLALKGPAPMDAMHHGDPVILLAAALSALCILFCVAAVFPRYPSAAQRAKLSETDRFSWPSLADSRFGAEAYSQYMQTAEVSQIVHSIARSNASIAAILLRKYVLLRVAFVFGAANLVVSFIRLAGIA
jgi:hypothetical protein